MFDIHKFDSLSKKDKQEYLRLEREKHVHELTFHNATCEIERAEAWNNILELKQNQKEIIKQVI